MGFLGFLLGAAIAMNLLDSRKSDQSQGIASDDDDEAQCDDGYSDDYLGDGLDGPDDDGDHGDDPE